MPITARQLKAHQLVSKYPHLHPPPKKILIGLAWFTQEFWKIRGSGPLDPPASYATVVT